MALDNMVVFDEFFMPAIYELLGQDIQKFNQASAGAIRLTAAGNVGDFLRESFYNALYDNQRRVDRYASNDPVAPVDLSQTEKVMVKVAGGFGPIRFEPGQMTWLTKPTGEAIDVISRMFVDAMMRDLLNTSIASAVAAIENNANTANDVSGGASIDYRAINGAHALFGDKSQMIRADIMTGAMAHRLIDQNLQNDQRLYESETVRVIDILGKIVVITDAPALLDTTPDPDLDKVLSLVEGGIEVRDPGNPIVNIDTTNGNARIQTTMQADYDFTVGIKGYSWDTVNGGKSPTDAELATGTNWDINVSDTKNTAGVITIGDVPA